MDTVSFSRSKISLISRFEWIISARASCCKRKLLRLLSKKTLHSGIELISEFPKEWVMITKILFCRVSYCFCLVGEFAKVLERQVRVAHLHSAARALSSPSRCFQFSIFQFPIMHSVSPPQVLHKLLLWNTLGNMHISQEHFTTIVYAKFGGQT